MEIIRILLIEDNSLLREGIADMLNSLSDFEVIARSEDGNALNQLKKNNTPPDIILLDLGLEKENSLGLMVTLLKEVPAARIIAMDIFPEQLDIVDFVKTGGSGFILKSASAEDYISTIRKVAAGEKVLPPALTNSLFTQIIESVIKSRNGLPDNSLKLTNRERDVIELISKGQSNKEIAESLHISTYTVKSHVHNILEKLALNTRLQIAAFTRQEQSD